LKKIIVYEYVCSECGRDGHILRGDNMKPIEDYICVYCIREKYKERTIGESREYLFGRTIDNIDTLRTLMGYESDPFELINQYEVNPLLDKLFGIGEG